METKEKTIRPFSNGTQCIRWYDEYCDRCVKAHKPTNGELPDFKTSQRLVNLGMECKFKLALDKAFFDGELPLRIAEEMGNKEEDYNLKCIHFSDDENDGWKPPKRTPPEQPDNQMVLPFIIDDIINNTEKESEIIEKYK